MIKRPESRDKHWVSTDFKEFLLIADCHRQPQIRVRDLQKVFLEHVHYCSGIVFAATAHPLTHPPTTDSAPRESIFGRSRVGFESIASRDSNLTQNRLETDSKSTEERLEIYAGSGLPQGPFLANNLFPLKSGFKMGFCQCLKWVQKWVKNWVFGCKSGSNVSKPTFAPTLNPFWHIHENPLFTQFKGGGNCFPKRALSCWEGGPRTGKSCFSNRVLVIVF